MTKKEKPNPESEVRNCLNIFGLEIGKKKFISEHILTMRFRCKTESQCEELSEILKDVFNKKVEQWTFVKRFGL